MQCLLSFSVEWDLVLRRARLVIEHFPGSTEAVVNDRVNHKRDATRHEGPVVTNHAHSEGARESSESLREGLDKDEETTDIHISMVFLVLGVQGRLLHAVDDLRERCRRQQREENTIEALADVHPPQMGILTKIARANDHTDSHSNEGHILYRASLCHAPFAKLESNWSRHEESNSSDCKKQSRFLGLHLVDLCKHGVDDSRLVEESGCPEDHSSHAEVEFLAFHQISCVNFFVFFLDHTARATFTAY